MQSADERLETLASKHRAKQIGLERELDDIKARKKLLESASDEYRGIAQRNTYLLADLASFLTVEQSVALKDVLSAEIEAVNRTFEKKDEEIEVEKRAASTAIEEELAHYKNQYNRIKGER